jgi:hypothetical protein
VFLLNTAMIAPNSWLNSPCTHGLRIMSYFVLCILQPFTVLDTDFLQHQ